MARTSAPARTCNLGRSSGRTSVTLPDDYRAFMLAYNGGRVYPLMFDYTIPRDRYPTTDPAPTTYLDPLYDWAMVENISNGGIFSRRNPPGMLVIGSNPGGMEILLSLHEATFGRIFTLAAHAAIPGARRKQHGLGAGRVVSRLHGQPLRERGERRLCVLAFAGTETPGTTARVLSSRSASSRLAQHRHQRWRLRRRGFRRAARNRGGGRARCSAG